MPFRTSAIAWLLVFAALGLPASIASAHPMDPTVHRLGIVSPTDFRPCSDDGVSLRDPTAGCTADNGTYQRMLVQLGNSFASAALSPARTVGYRHFYVGAEVSFTHLNGSTAATPPATTDASTSADWQQFRSDNFMRLSTEGSYLGAGSSPADQQARYANGNRFVSSTYAWTRIAFRKGLPLGFEFGGSAGHILQTGMWAFSFEVKWSLFEGFRRRFPGGIPDLALRGSVTTIAGIRGFTLTVPTFDAILSKGFVLGDTVTMTPFVAGQMVWIMADSEVIDVTPGNLADNTGDRALITFDRVRQWHPRVLAGLQFQYTRFVVNGAFRYDIGNPARGLPLAGTMPKQWSIDAAVGVVY